MSKRRIELEVETEKIVLRGPAPRLDWCRECGTDSAKLTAEQASMVMGISEMSVYRMIEAGLLHKTETSDGRLRICLRSLDQFEKNK